jgi:hypothetical protein
LSEQELTKILPKLLRENPDLRYQVVGILAESFVTKGEQAALLEEIRKLGANLTRLIDTQETRFEQVDKRFEELIAQMDKRFEQVDKRFEELIAQMDKRFEQVDKRFEQVDKRFEELIAQMDKRFEQVDKRFEQVDKRFEELIAQMDKRFEELIAQMDKRFEQVDKRFEEQDGRFAQMVVELNRQNKRLEVTIGSMGRRWGSDLEKTVLEIFRETLREKGVYSERVEKFTFKDVDGKYSGKKGFKVDVDIMLHDGRVTLVEVKSRAELEHVEALLEKRPLIEKIQGRKVDRLIIVAVNIDRDALERAEELGIETVYGSVLE